MSFAVADGKSASGDLRSRTDERDSVDESIAAKRALKQLRWFPLALFAHFAV